MKQFDSLSVAFKKISYQFPDTPEGQLMLAIVYKAFQDALLHKRNCDVGRGSESYRKSAKAEALIYIDSIMPHAEACGVDSGWICRVVRQCGVEFNTQFDYEPNYLQMRDPDMRRSREALRG